MIKANAQLLQCWNTTSVSERAFNKLGVLTLKEGDHQLGRLRGVFSHGRASDGVNGPISTKRNTHS